MYNTLHADPQYLIRFQLNFKGSIYRKISSVGLKFYCVSQKRALYINHSVGYSSPVIITERRVKVEARCYVGEVKGADLEGIRFMNKNGNKVVKHKRHFSFNNGSLWAMVRLTSLMGALYSTCSNGHAEAIPTRDLKAASTVNLNSTTNSNKNIMANGITELTKENFDAFTSQGLVLVDFWAPWCGPCKALGPVLESIAGKVGGKIKIGKVNVDNEDNGSLSANYNVRSIPTLIFLKDGQILETSVGLLSEDVLMSKIDTYAK